MSTKFGSLKVNDQVLIKRSNGRVHEAMVSKLDHDTAAVHVEWFENDDVKGKDLMLDAVFNLNPKYKPDSKDQNVQKDSRSKIGQYDARKSVLIQPGQSRFVTNKIYFIAISPLRNDTKRIL